MVKDIAMEKPWHYQSCFGCTSKPQQKNPSKKDFVLWCNTCKKTSETQTIRYRIELKAQDSLTSTTFVLFDKEAKRIVGQDALSLYDSQPIEDEDDEDCSHVHDLLYNTFVGKEFQFKVKVTKADHSLSKKKSFNIVDISENKNEDDTKPKLKETMSELQNPTKRPRQIHILDEPRTQTEEIKDPESTPEDN
ncbi:hypothetical protein KSS87_009883 [Heliosperma pusillum]|nr:hypothetical protein KSS87_009883 [Heliosperma pusillum]